MLTIAQIAAIIGLLVAFNAPPQVVADVESALNGQQITSQQQATMQEATTTAGSPQTAQPSTTAAPSGATTPPPAAPQTATAPSSRARIEVISPIPGKGLGRSYKAAAEVSDESNYVELGAVLYDDAGNPVRDARMAITATDGVQDAIEVGTGDVTNVWRGGQKIQVPVYSYHYEFTTPGKHTITFEANGLTALVELEAE